MTRLSIPCQWDKEKLTEIISIESEHGVKISEMYGTISSENLPHGRVNSLVEKIYLGDALNIKSILNKNKIELAYLLNAPFYKAPDSVIKDELSIIIETLKPDSLTISSLELMELIRNNYKNIKINISTIAGIKTIKQIKSFSHIRPSKIILHHDANRNFTELKEIKKYGMQNDIDIEIMLNESCIRYCSRRDDHYKTISKEMDDHDFHIWCNSIKLQNPYQLLMANFILPEDMAFYEDLGIDIFKVTGRSKPLGWLYEVVKAYLNRKYEGNLVRLLAIDPKLHAEKWIYINSKLLNNFLKGYPKDNNLDTEISYCKKVIKEIYENSGFIVENKNISYQIENDNLIGNFTGGIYYDEN